MSNINILRAVENIKSGTNVYTPLIEVIVNAIQAIEEKKEAEGKVNISIIRSEQLEIGNSIPPVTGFIVEDNGNGFTEGNRDSFNTLYSDYKLSQGGKGFGRFTCLKYFEDLKIESVFLSNNEFKKRTFEMGKNKNLIVNESVEIANEEKTGTIVKILDVKNNGLIDKKLQTIAKTLLERLLPYFIDDEYNCPTISISEKDGAEKIILNEFVSNQISKQISEIDIYNPCFELKGANNNYQFKVRVFKFYSPKNQKSKISLVAHRREVVDTPIHNYVPEFIEEFFDPKHENSNAQDKNYIIKIYVYSDYLDENVSLERGGFDFNKDNDLLHGISQSEIEEKAANIAKDAIGEEIYQRQEKKKERVQSYVNEEAPWHRLLLNSVDLSSMPYNPSNEDIELRLQKEKYQQEVKVKASIRKIIEKSSDDDFNENLAELVGQISEASKNDLVHYVAFRKKVLDLFGKKLSLNADGKYTSEGIVHDIIFPRRKDSETISLDEHNLWIIDERLNFTDYLSSDMPLDSKGSNRPDVIAYDRRILFRGDNEASNPVTIFEFKKPQRDDFANPSSTEDPVQQIIRYVNKVRDGDFKTPEGRNVLIAENTPFYGYVICDLSSKVTRWLEREKDFKPMPDKLGWFKWIDNINLYIEVLSWDKVLRDAEMRSKIFFHKLGIE